MVVKSRLKCEGCIRPVARRLALIQAKDEYECYADGYVKCFWGLCDHHKSNDGFVPKADGTVITNQPTPQELPYKNRAIMRDIYVKD